MIYFIIMKNYSTHIAFVTVIFTALAAMGEPFEAVNEKIGLKGLPDLYAAFGDYNNDGWVDLYNGGRLWRNDRGTYTFIRGHGLTNEPGIWADYDNDGRLDLYKWMSNKLYRNINGEKFIDVSDKLPVAPMASSKGACWGDFNGDGFVDIYVGGWEEPGYQPDAIYLNAGNGEFNLHWKEAKNHRPARGVTAADIDGDGDLDIYVSNYRLEQNLLWINDGKGDFRVAPRLAMLELVATPLDQRLVTWTTTGCSTFSSGTSAILRRTRIARSFCATWGPTTGLSLKT